LLGRSCLFDASAGQRHPRSVAKQCRVRLAERSLEAAACHLRVNLGSTNTRAMTVNGRTNHDRNAALLNEVVGIGAEENAGQQVT
jgi:hypothetical protein